MLALPAIGGAHFNMAAAAEYQHVMLSAMENDDDEMLLMLLQDQERTGHVTYDPEWPRFDLETLTDDQCREYFRFYKDDIKRLVRVLHIPNKIICENDAFASGTDAFCILLRRMVYPNRLADLEPMFGRPKSTLSMISKEMLNFILQEHGHLLENFDQPWLDQAHLQTYADVIHAKGAPLRNCIGFIDGTVRPISRPTVDQRVVFNGHKRTHALKYQSVVTPNGLIANLFGPIEGRRHDCALLRLSGLAEKVEALGGQFEDRNGDRFAIYGDPAYPIRDWLLSPFKQAVLTAEQQQFNGSMSQVRESVEWQFGKIVNLFAFVDYKKNQKLFLQPVGKIYLVAALLSNFHTCLYGSQTSQYFGLDPPTIEEYVG
ncbi:protein ALP1-like [Lingula anatina]|uniref:Protein ALP1-like n=1 Tax=Lingula anatina TaxID=7574 RepID=A0A1S3HMG5_LINAN|nr:protein ALP1-like [Lingula anatina]|eukprot:XP_013386696.1 protein ALP1-like [Lingula anatina]